ncbi:hypothetical protein DMN77_09395 [Paenibacillus sp. 79R4]|uniref:hypothetical protein n=1 Tax=Paenibacillus sp. 79R4 TaxID=2212847 RepID=UPI0015BDC4C3|nr:hypothetical protein [Paenibacillus sp. 79R4]NWL87815.1 hypothetical protein [Paenibacillus sp. 79R4]
MRLIEISDRHIKDVTMFLIQNKLIFHPKISPEGTPDFTNYYGRDYILILDRNILTKLIELCIQGTLNDNYLLKVVGSIMFWAEFNGVRITAGIALNEYAYNLKDNLKASKENNIFLEIFDFYSPLQWLDLALGVKNTIPPITLSKDLNSYTFNVENDHYKMHYAEMLHITLLLADQQLNNTEKMIEFIKWNNDNLLFCQYTLIYACLLFSRKIKQINIKQTDEIFKKCRNQAWDLTYLSFWSTLYWEDSESNEVFLFGTMDKDLKRIFITTHEVNKNPFVECFGEDKGIKIHKEFQKIISNRVKPHISEDYLNRLIEIEEKNLIKVIV